MRERFDHLPFRLAHAAENDIRASESGPLRPIQFPTRDYVHPCAESAENAEQGDVGICLDTVMKAVRQPRQRGRQAVVLGPYAPTL